MSLVTQYILKTLQNVTVCVRTQKGVECVLQMCKQDDWSEQASTPAEQSGHKMEPLKELKKEVNYWGT